MKEIYNKNYKTLSERNQGHKDILCSWIGRIMFKVSILLKAIYRLIWSKAHQNTTIFFTEIEKEILKFCMKTQKTLNSQSNTEDKEQK